MDSNLTIPIGLLTKSLAPAWIKRLRESSLSLLGVITTTILPCKSDVFRNEASKSKPLTFPNKMSNKIRFGWKMRTFSKNYFPFDIHSTS